MKSQVAWRAVFWIFGFILLVFLFVPIWHALRGHSTKDYWVWYQTGQMVLQGGEVYPDQFHKFPFMYPPPCAIFLAPISALGLTGLVIVLALVIAAGWTCSIIFSVRLATRETEARHVLIYVVPSFIMGAHVWGNFLLGQPSLVLLALMLGAFLALQQKREIAAGLLIAFAAAIKAFPAIALVYLIYRRSWTAAAVMIVASSFFLFFLPVPFRGYSTARQDVERWSSGMLFKYDESGVGQRLGRSTSWKNQSIWGVANRLLRHIEYDHKFEPHEPVYANLADLSFRTVNTIILVTAFSFGLVFVGVMPRRKRRTRETDAIEFALLLLLVLLFTPLSFGYLFAWLIYPFTVVTARAVTGVASRGLIGCAIAAVILLALSIPFQLVANAYGSTFCAALVLFAGLAMELWRIKRPAAPDSLTPAVQPAPAI